jgi:hypothetical protein
VNPQPWDPSIKSLTQFPTVLDTMNQSLAWTSALGEAYYNQPADVMNAVQVLRNMAMSAGTLKTTEQQKVEVQPAPPAAQGSTQPSMQQTVIIQPAQQNTVYVPQYNPTTAYGAPVPAPAGYTGSDLLLTGVLSFGAGMLLGSLINNGNNNWGCNWGGSSSSVVYKNQVYVTNNNVYPGRYPSGGYPSYGGGYRPPGAPGYRPPAAGGYPRPMPYPATRPGYNPAGPNTRPYDKASARPINSNIANAGTPKFPKASTLPGEGNLAKPNFPKPATLPNSPGSGAGNMKPGNNARPMPNQPATRPPNGLAKNDVPSNRPAAGNATTRDRSADSKRGFAPAGQERVARGDRSGALGGYEPGGAAQRNSNRGQGSLKGGGGGGGGGNRGGGGGNRGNGGGGGRKGR